MSARFQQRAIEVRTVVERFRGLGRETAQHPMLCNCEACRKLMTLGDAIGRIPVEVIEEALAEMPTFRRAAG